MCPQIFFIAEHSSNKIYKNQQQRVIVILLCVQIKINNLSLDLIPADVFFAEACSKYLTLILFIVELILFALTIISACTNILLNLSFKLIITNHVSQVNQSLQKNGQVSILQALHFLFGNHYLKQKLQYDMQQIRRNQNVYFFKQQMPYQVEQTNNKKQESQMFNQLIMHFHPKLISQFVFNFAEALIRFRSLIIAIH
ncbi:transmembrane protein, putative (macronuclear) [Tetrahymena thermophila SB210]|uniref:Transmembrane protein, putative n=1 Tax=Tetrahymena thermophila (strain SB210) TaxID=312017 RepID=W7XEY6_TETTS|nr:transmembrane protein, putative [Tetrahymena thermophila SB210]EWS75323.1 transmembrane protein, putative [Tetrahymena thermophila SB210]|eukprot:XP_012652155.1 transmembrane protein, putative [Tetrahymena thermophila SB210]